MYQQLIDTAEEYKRVYSIGKNFHFRGTHVYINYDFTGDNTRFLSLDKYWHSAIMKRDINTQHRVHIFFAQENPSFENGELRKFVEKAYEASKRKVIIHIPKTMDGHAMISLMMAVEDFDGCRVIVERPNVVTSFRYRYYGKEQFLCVGWRKVVNSKEKE